MWIHLSKGLSLSIFLRVLSVLASVTVPRRHFSASTHRFSLPLDSFLPPYTARVAPTAERETLKPQELKEKGVRWGFVICVVVFKPCNETRRPKRVFPLGAEFLLRASSAATQEATNCIELILNFFEAHRLEGLFPSLF